MISPAQEADVLVLAGDIHNGNQAIETFAPWISDSKMAIVYVAGNNDFYSGSMNSVRQRLKESATEYGIHYLECETVVLGGVRFLGFTLWTDFALRSMYGQEHVMEDIQRPLMDHYEIRKDTALITPRDTLALHLKSRK